MMMATFERWKVEAQESMNKEGWNYRDQRIVSLVEELQRQLSADFEAMTSFLKSDEEETNAMES